VGLRAHVYYFLTIAYFTILFLIGIVVAIVA
jgi:hypothetical protein